MRLINLSDPIKPILFSLVGIIFLACTACTPDLPEDIAEAYHVLPAKLDYNLHVKPILSDRCFACHGNDQNKLKANLRLDDPEYAFKALTESPGKFALKPGKLQQSEVFHRITSGDPEYQMPPPDANLTLTPQEKAILIKWIEEGAEYKPHWAFVKAQKPPIPKVQDKAWSNNSIDLFVLKKLEELEMNPSPPADKALLLRRLSLDLTGLPPTPEETQSFLADTSTQAYEKQVDRLFSSIHYAEKMATDWMDVARFSDTYGYQVDQYRDMSPWRDWVIQAFHKNMPYDQFLIWQLAGDLLPNAQREQKLATAFNRLHPMNSEDGIVGEEYRVESVADRVAVLGDGIMGLTLSCAKCHDHKYDPISQKEYYQLYAFFNTINETGQIARDQTTPPPTLFLPTPHQEKILPQLKQQLEQETQHLQRVSESEKASIASWIDNQAYQKIANKLPLKGLVAHFPLDRSPIQNRLNPSQKGIIEREFGKREKADFQPGYQGKSLKLNGDAWLDVVDVGIFKRNEAFSIGLWVNIPQELEEGVIFHKGKATMLHAYRGFHLYLIDNQLQWMMAHTYPENALIEHTLDEVPREEWVHLMVTYDGSSTAAGSRIYVNGKEVATQVDHDNLHKDIIFHDLVDVIYPKPLEPNIKIGGRWRGKGLVNGKVDELRVYDRELTALEVMQLVDGKASHDLLSRTSTELSKQDREQLSRYYLAHLSQPYRKASERLNAARSAWVDSVENVKEIMVMEEQEKPRPTYVLSRGVYDNPGEEVFPNTPNSLMEMPEDFPKNRLGLAKWLTHPDHPLTARVVVNRYWQQYFGRGLVETSQDFGNQGALPSHPELLDWLAVWFVENNWDVKAFQRLLVTSATYQQSSHASPEALEIDTDNIWLARGPSVRLTSEMIRDNALAACGLLNREVGGESIKPYQPEGLWAMNTDPYIQDQGDKLYRRSLYVFGRRTIPNPTLGTFDQPERNVCTVKRQKTNTPLQALVLLNDPTFIEVSKVLGEQMTQQKDTRTSIKNTFQLLTGRKPQEKELDLLVELQAKEYQQSQQQPQKTKGWLATGAYAIDPQLDPNQVYAHAVVANVILNSDATIMKR